MSTEENKGLEVFGTKEVSVKEFMGSTDKSLMLLSDYEKAKQNLSELKEKHEARVEELVSSEKLSTAELKELNTIRAELREPRYLIQNIEKNNISVFEAYKKTDKSKLKDLIDINRNLEDIASDKIKLEDDRKKTEKEAKEKEEEIRIERIKKEIDDVETYCYQVIQKMDFENMKVSSESVAKSLGAEYDFEEFDLLFDQVKERVGKMLMDKTNDITEREKQRQDNEAMKKEIFEVRVNRLKEVGYYLENGEFKSEIFDDGITESFILDCNSISFEKTLGDIKNAISANEQAKRDAEIQNQKDEQFDVRKNRLFEIGFGITDNLHFMFCKEFPNVTILTDKIFQSSIREFEEIMSKAKQDIVDAKEQKEIADKKERFEKRKQMLLDLGFTYDANCEYNFSHKYWSCFHEQVDDNTDDWFAEYLVDIKNAISKGELADKKKADAENKARVKRLAEDKEWLRQNIELSVIEIQDVSIKNKEALDFVESANAKILGLKSELLTQLNEL